MSDLFNVYQFFPDDTSEKVRENVSAEEAMKAVEHYCTCIGAQIGTTVRVIITDQLDYTNFEWIRGKGVVFPKSGEGP
jgi:hypothetical protein